MTRSNYLRFKRFVLLVKEWNYLDKQGTASDMKGMTVMQPDGACHICLKYIFDTILRSWENLNVVITGLKVI